MKEREQIGIYFVAKDPADRELWEWLEKKTTNKNAFIKRVLYHHMLQYPAEEGDKEEGE